MNKNLLILLALAAVIFYLVYQRNKKKAAIQTAQTKAAVASNQVTTTNGCANTGTSSLVPTSNDVVVFNMSEDGYLETVGTGTNDGVGAIYPNNDNIIVLSDY